MFHVKKLKIKRTRRNDFAEGQKRYLFSITEGIYEIFWQAKAELQVHATSQAPLY